MAGDDYNPIFSTSTFDAEEFQRLLIESVVDSTIEAQRLRYAPFRAAYDAAFANWERLIDAPGMPDPRGAYAILNLHYPWILEEIGCVGCIHCGIAWPCRHFADLAEQERTAR